MAKEIFSVTFKRDVTASEATVKAVLPSTTRMSKYGLHLSYLRLLCQRQRKKSPIQTKRICNDNNFVFCRTKNTNKHLMKVCLDLGYIVDNSFPLTRFYFHEKFNFSHINRQFEIILELKLIFPYWLCSILLMRVAEKSSVVIPRLS